MPFKRVYFPPKLIAIDVIVPEQGILHIAGYKRLVKVPNNRDSCLQINVGNHQLSLLRQIDLNWFTPADTGQIHGATVNKHSNPLLYRPPQSLGKSWIYVLRRTKLLSIAALHHKEHCPFHLTCCLQSGQLFKMTPTPGSNRIGKHGDLILNQRTTFHFQEKLLTILSRQEKIPAGTAKGILRPLQLPILQSMHRLGAESFLRNSVCQSGLDRHQRLAIWGFS